MKNIEDLAQLAAQQKQQITFQNQQLWDLKVLINQVVCENQDLHAKHDEMHNMIVLLKEENQRLKDEIATLKGQKPKPKIPPSTLEGTHSKDKQNDKNRRTRGKHPRCKKTNRLEVHDRQRIKPEFIPESAVFKGCQKRTIQDIVLKPFNTIYELERWMLPDGTYLPCQMPKNIHGHYGAHLVAYILHQYYGCRVTEPLLFAGLKEMGVLISEGQLNNILIRNKDAFHQEKNDLLPAGIATGQIKVDDAGARHKGKNGYSNIIGNDFFTSIVTTASKSRLNFLQILHGASPQYLINEDAAGYVENLKPGSWLIGYLFLQCEGRAMTQVEWDQFLIKINITKKDDVRLVTEAALFASLIENGVPKNLGVHGDDAGQFDIFVRSLCWIHEERHYRKIIPVDDATRIEIEQVREKIWDLYAGLKEFKISPSERQKLALEQKFESLFSKTTTISPTLNKHLANTYAKKEELLRVLVRPETPLHNNGTETDAREMVVKKKVSGGTRSDEGRKCRDTLVSLKLTCRKLGISFWSYLEDRVSGALDIPNLAQIIRTRSARQPAEP
jgi:hypothetical protein